MSRSAFHLLVTLCPFFLVGCFGQAHTQQAITPIRNTENLQQVMSKEHRYFIMFPKPERFSVCHNLSCQAVSQVSLSVNEWSQIELIFHPEAKTAQLEREQIKKAISYLEVIVGERIGTSYDLAKNHLTGSRQGQLDCIDEATNTSVYLKLLEQASLLKWHQTASRTSRGLLRGLAPHNTATITDKTTLQRYAVDAWFGANGEPPAIVPLNDWLAGWEPNS